MNNNEQHILKELIGKAISEQDSSIESEKNLDLLLEKSRKEPIKVHLLQKLKEKQHLSTSSSNIIELFNSTENDTEKSAACFRNKTNISKDTEEKLKKYKEEILAEDDNTKN